MRHRDIQLMEQIHEFIDDRYLEQGTTPSTREIAIRFGISPASAYNYLGYLSESGDIVLKNGKPQTEKMKKSRTRIQRVPLVGSVACGNPMTEEEQIEGYYPLPAEILGFDECYLLRARGNSMVDAGISPGDIVVIHKTTAANEGDIVVALTDSQESTMKRYVGVDPETGLYLLQYENQKDYPDMIISVRQFRVQGVAKKVIKNL